MKTKQIILAAAVIIAAVSCTKESAKEVLPCSNVLSLSAGTETKAWLDASTSNPDMKWRITDSLVVFDTDLKGVALGTTTNNVTTATFSTDKWTGKVPCYAAAYCPNYGEAKIMTAPAEGVLSVKFRAVHTIDNINATSFQSSACVGKTEQVADEYVVSQMKNVMGFIGFTIGGTNVASVKIKSLNGEGLAGWVDVNYTKLVDGDSDFWTATPDRALADSIVLTPAKAGAANRFKGQNVTPVFNSGTYYASVLPQAYTKGLSLTAYDANGDVVAARTVGTSTGITIKRNEITPITGKIDIIPLSLPDEFVVSLDFTTGTNPLGFTDPGVANENATTGETYPYLFRFTNSKTGLPDSTTVNFTVCRSTTTSTHYYYKEMSGNSYGTGYVLVFDAQNSWIQLPAFEGRYLQAVSVGIANGYGKEFGIKTIASSSSSVGIKTAPKGTATGPTVTTMSFYTNGNDGTNTGLQANTTSISTSYCLHLRSANGTRLSSLSLKFTKTLPTK